MTTPARIRVLADTSALADNRAAAGIGRYAMSLVEELRRRDDVELFTARPPVRPPSEAWVARFAWAQPVVGPLAAIHRVDVVHGLASDPVLFWPLTRQVVTLHDALPWAVERPPGVTARYLAMQQRRLRGCAAVIAVSQVTADEAVQFLGLSPDRVTVVPEAISPLFTSVPGPEDEVMRRRAGIPDSPYLLWVGSMRAYDVRKGLDGLLEAVSSGRHPATTLVMAGAPGAESRRLAAEAARLKVNLVLPGFVDDATLAALYRGAAVALLPSLHEGFGLTALEAMASGTPLVAAKSANLPALAGDSALSVPPGDSAALGAAIDRLLEDPVIAAGLRARGPETAAQYTWARTAELTVAVYREVLARAG